MSLELQRIGDELVITALLNSYARAVDTKDWELYRSVFTGDAVIDYTSAGAIAGSRDEVTDWLAAGFAAIPMSMHYITNIESVIVGDTATVRAMFFNPMQLPGVNGLSYCGGYYHHQMVRTRTGGAVAVCARRTSGSSTGRAGAEALASEKVRRRRSR